MKNANDQHAEAILNCIKKAAPGLTLEGVKEQCPKVSDILIRKLLKEMLNANIITVNPDDGTYSFIGSKKAEAHPKDTKAEKKDAAKPDAKANIKTEKKKEEADLGPPTPSRRDQTRYDFYSLKGLSKGRLAHAIIKKYATEHPKISLSKLEELFKNKEVQVRYGIFAPLQAAHKHTKNKRERYFLKQEDIIKVGPQRTAIAVTNQWDVKNIGELIKVSRALGMKITVATK